MPNWDYEAREQFARIYARLSVTEQRALADTVERVERALASDPLDCGEERGRDAKGRHLRFWYAPPLGVYFVVTAAGVVITSVRTRGTPR